MLSSKHPQLDTKKQANKQAGSQDETSPPTCATAELGDARSSMPA